MLAAEIAAVHGAISSVCSAAVCHDWTRHSLSCRTLAFYLRHCRNRKLWVRRIALALDHARSAQ